MDLTVEQLLKTHQTMSPSEAVTALKLATKKALSNPELGVNLVSALLERQQLEDALALVTELTRKHPDFAPGWSRLAEVLLKLGEVDRALESAKKGLELRPDSGFCRLCFAIALKAAGRISEATVQLAHCLGDRPQNPAAFSHYGLALSQQGRHAMALDALAKARDLNPQNPSHYSNWLMTQQYLPLANSDDLRQAAAGFSPASNTRGERTDKLQGPPVVGVISSDFYHHPVGIFLLPVLQAMVRQTGRWHLYHDSTRSDAVTQQLQQVAGQYVSSAGLNDEQLAQQLKADGINVLIELNGHTANNRLSLMAQRVAPVQLSWLGYPASSGLANIDGVLMGEGHITSASPHYFVEELVRLPGCHLLYPFRQPPANERLRQPGPIRLGCFNNSAKLNEWVLDAWADVLSAIPQATLLLKWRSFADPEYRRHLRALIQVRGVDPQRLLFEGHTSHEAMMARYADVDIALDTFPFNGGLTTCEALAAGTPVVSMAGSRPVSRQGAAILGELGHSEWVAQSRQQYVAAVAALAADPQRLQQLRIVLPTELHQYQTHQAPALAHAIKQHINGYFCA